MVWLLRVYALVVPHVEDFGRNAGYHVEAPRVVLRAAVGASESDRVGDVPVVADAMVVEGLVAVEFND